MANEELTKEIQNAIGILSKKYDYDSAVLEKEVKDLMTSKDLEAKEGLREWKRTHRWIAYTKDHNFMVFGATEPKTITKKRGTPEEEQAEISSLDVIVQTDDGLKAYVVSFWDENVDQVNQFSIDQCYTARMSLKKNGYANIIGGKVEKLDKQVIPKTAELAEKLEYTGVDDLASKNRELVFFKGDIMDWIEKDGANIGVKIDSLIGFPANVWFNGYAAPLEEDTEVKGFGRVSVRDDGEVHVYADVVF